ncbi:hypothetical protein [Proteiniphilum sp. X52]|uniref:hypothetical protein n=1 Tax=Proteiniphilum sp. X52 TaxID=2382159 RepID=UPI000F09ACBE|nr:hypothetical protein [Proteiniphilum sp. X52]RNC64560.1 hypothetical protein D7D25_10630 [Proteiniphilum sp. X52]
MKKIFYLIGISTLFLFVSCNNEDIPRDDVPQSVSEVKLYTPVMQGVFGKFTESNSNIGTRSGVIEDNPDYALGEKFYWHDGDQVKMLFFPGGDLNEEPIERIYTAVVAGGEKPDKAPFIPDPGAEGIPAGTYTVYGLYPAAGWTREGAVYKAAIFETDMGGNYIREPLPISEASSKHLGRYMFMKAKATDVVIGEEGTNMVDLSYQHLASVIRVRITNENPPSAYPRLFRMSMGVDVDGSNDGFNGLFNPEDAYLDGGIDGDLLVPGPTSKLNVAAVQIVNDALNGLDFNLFIPILPTGPLGSSRIVFQGRVYVNEGDEGSSSWVKTPVVPKDVGAGLPQGFEAGKSYTFNLTIPTTAP